MGAVRGLEAGIGAELVGCCSEFRFDVSVGKHGAPCDSWVDWNARIRHTVPLRRAACYNALAAGTTAAPVMPRALDQRRGFSHRVQFDSASSGRKGQARIGLNRRVVVPLQCHRVKVPPSLPLGKRSESILGQSHQKWWGFLL